VTLLRRYGCEIAATAANGRTLLMLACRGGYEELAEYLLREGVSVHTVDSMNCTALHQSAAFDDRSSIIKLPLAHGTDVNAPNVSGIGSLFSAAKCGSLANTEALLAAGACVLRSDCVGETASHVAVRSTHLAVVQLLLQHGADAVLNTMQYRRLDDHSAVSALMLCKDTAILKLLLAAGADVHAVTSSGDTCLHIAARQNYSAPVVCLLIKAGADMHAVNSAGNTAAAVALNIVIRCLSNY
jgi:uncharacterized protein